MTSASEAAMRRDQRGDGARRWKTGAAPVAAWLWACGGLAAPVWAQPVQLNLPNRTVSQGYELDYATDWVKAAQGFAVNGSASVAFNAGNKVYLEPGFHATAGSGAGAVFHAYIGAIASMPPSNVSVTPGPGSGSAQTFAFTAYSPYGFQDIGSFQVIFNSGLTAVNGCYLSYSPGSN